ncbi:MAG: ATP-binding cassette domain-containing protein [Clostridiales bacterium]|nr:ATP-binding cassette domain-containing protein [Clostridiales bacterium]
MNDTILKTINLCKNYGNNSILTNVNLNIKKGEIYGLIGKNGAGKTTLIRLLLSFAFPTSGEIKFYTKDDIKIGALVEAPSFFSYLSASENLEYYRLLNGFKDPKSVNKILELVGLQDVGKKKFKDFSLGMKQRLGIALAMLGNPEILILDEPINGLDPTGIKEIRDILLKINKEKGVTILISSHILSELSQLATFYGFIHKGRFIEEISAIDLKNKCKNCISLEVDNPEKAINILNTKLNIKEMSTTNKNTLNVYEYLDKSNIVNKTLIENGIELFSSSTTGNTLEGYFLNLIGGNAND